MTTTRYITLITIFLASTPLVAARELPDDIEPGDGVNEIQLPLTKLSAAELIRIETSGKVLSVSKTKKNKYFRIKVLHDNGKVKHYILDPQTGYHPR